MQPIQYYEDDDFAKNEILHDLKNADSKYIYPKLIMTETYINCIKNNHGNFFKINENTRNLYFELAAILNKVC